jgi:predicted S18 family serine protease
MCRTDRLAALVLLALLLVAPALAQSPPDGTAKLACTPPP